MQVRVRVRERDALVEDGTPIEVCALIDNKALISRIKGWDIENLKIMLAPNYDLLQVAKQITRKHSILKPAHVKSHQDDEVSYNQLTWQARLNCDCDALAELPRTCQQCKTERTPKHILPPGHGASLSIGKMYVTGHMAQEVKQACFRQE